MKMNIDNILDIRKKESRLPTGAVIISIIIHVALIYGMYYVSRHYLSQPSFKPFITASLIPAKGLPSFRPGTTVTKSRTTSTKVKTTTKKVSAKDAVKLPGIKKRKSSAKPETKRTVKKENGQPPQEERRSRIIVGKERGSYGRQDGIEGGTGAGPGTISTIGLEDFDYPWYAQSVKGILSYNWVKSIAPPDLAGTRVVVRFRIHKDGSVTDIVLIKRSGIFALDQEVIRAVRNASPLPPLPKGTRGESQVAQYEFVY
jgi:protein TonB